MTHVRPAAVAGAFYPVSAQVLSREVTALLDGASATPGPLPKAIIVPHAGYIYSGAIAASAYQRLTRTANKIKRVILLGPAHRVALRGLALPEAKYFATPLGDIGIDQYAYATLSDLEQVSINAAAHAQEHALEVQLPFLQKLLGDFKLVPLVVGDALAAEVAQVLDRLWGGPETLIVVSTDLSHYLPYKVAQRVDEQTVQMILQLRSDIRHEQACGGTPLNGLLLAARRHGLTPELLDQRNSGDTAGDTSRVVGYASFAFYEPQPDGH